MENTNLSGNKVFHTALVISPPESLWEPIQKIRKQFDKAYDRWPPHINLEFPFVPPEEFKKFVSLLQPEFDKFESFTIKLEKFHYFNQKDSTMHLVPESNGDLIQKIYDVIETKCPFLNDLKNKNEKKIYVPHLTCGQYSKNQIAQVLDNYQKQWKPIEFECEQLNLITRDSKDAPFHVVETIKLKKKTK